MSKPERFLFICGAQRPPGHPRGSCGEKGSGELMGEAAAQFDQKGLFGKVGLIQTGCQGPCQAGPVASVFPDNVWYKGVSAADIETIIDEHLIGGKPVESLTMSDSDWG